MCRTKSNQILKNISGWCRKLEEKKLSARADWWGSSRAEERVDKSGEAARLLSVYQLKTSRCSSAEKWRLPWHLWAARNLICHGMICPPCELLHCCQHIIITQTATKRSGWFWSGTIICVWIILTWEERPYISSAAFGFVQFFPLLFCRYIRLKQIHYTCRHDILLFCSLCAHSNFKE